MNWCRRYMWTLPLFFIYHHSCWHSPVWIPSLLLCVIWERKKNKKKEKKMGWSNFKIINSILKFRNVTSCSWLFWFYFPWHFIADPHRTHWNIYRSSFFIRNEVYDEITDVIVKNETIIAMQNDHILVDCSISETSFVFTRKQSLFNACYEFSFSTQPLRINQTRFDGKFRKIHLKKVNKMKCSHRVENCSKNVRVAWVYLILYW